MTSRRRSRPTPWLYRWSRPLMGMIAVAGAVITGYLTVTKLSGQSAACPTQGCEQVLNSPYATVLGQPLTLWGFVAYVSMAAIALLPLLLRSQPKERQTTLEQWTGWLLVIGSTAMVVFSGYLMYLLVAKIQAACLYCIVSALFSLGLWILALRGRDWPDVGQVAFISFLAGIIALSGTIGVYSTVNAPQAPTANREGEGPAITTTSGPAELALAQHLKTTGAKMYGAFWCPHCHDQKQLFGKQAVAQVPYVECDPKGANAQPQQCLEAGVQSYPTWEVNGNVYRGTQSLQQLAQASNYPGPKNFQRSLP